MAKKGKGGTVLAIGLGFGAVALASAALAGDRRKMPKMSLEQVLELVEKYSKALGVPRSLVIAIFNIESNFRIDAENHTPRAEARGGAWGIGQITLETAKDITKRFPETAKKLWPNWDGTGPGLLDPHINIAMSAFLLARDYKHFTNKGDAWLLAGLAHHQGRGNVEKFLREGNGKIVEDKLPPNGKRYWLQLKDYRQYAADVV